MNTMKCLKDSHYTRGPSNPVNGFSGKSYTSRWPEGRLLFHFGDEITITKGTGKNSILNFSGFANQLLYEKWHSDRREDEEEAKRRIVKLAAQIILKEIRSAPCRMDVYPDFDDYFRTPRLFKVLF